MSAIENNQNDVNTNNSLYMRRYRRVWGKYYKAITPRVSPTQIIRNAELMNVGEFEKSWKTYIEQVRRFLLFTPNCAEKEAYNEWVTEWKKTYRAITETSRFCKSQRKTGTRDTSNCIEVSERMIYRHRELRETANKMLMVRTIYKAAYAQLNYNR